MLTRIVSKDSDKSPQTPKNPPLGLDIRAHIGEKLGHAVAAGGRPSFDGYSRRPFT